MADLKGIIARAAGVAMASMALWVGGCIGPGVNSDLLPNVAPNRFPAVTGIDLEGRIIQVPSDLKGKRILVIAAYVQEHQELVDTWIEQLPVLQKDIQGLTFYELPVIKQGSVAFRFWVNNGMRSGISEPERRRSVVTVYTDVEAFRRVLGIQTLKTVTVFILNESGTILAQCYGAYSEASHQQLTRQVSGWPQG